ncbi:MAG: class I SAM-dependent methyltransferase [Flavobacteriaceae bacterium]|nr:class I SAM-dependent methyltransferase [Muriicola sp.]NNC61485.1 class I SAM-dependent methyltransferase [Eudoraea sp.]NNL38384.1 class I SAM-dependent methyltransferase [Flavobacteriaceae bacterium]
MTEYLRTRDFMVSQEEFVLMYDEQLQLLRTEPQPDNITAYYQDEAYISHTDKNNSLLEKIYHLVRTIGLNKKRRWLKKYLQQETRILDVGAGTGSFVLYLKEKGFTIDGVEPSSKARKVAKAKGIDLKEGISDLGERSYDAITLWHVLEHFKDLDQSIDEITSRIKKGGFLYIAVPNFRSYDAKHYGDYWAAYDVPRHLWHFSKESIHKIFTRKGFSVLDARPMLFDSFYISLLSERYKSGKDNWLAAFWHGLRSNLYGWKTGEYSSLVYILKKDSEPFKGV